MHRTLSLTSFLLAGLLAGCGSPASPGASLPGAHLAPQTVGTRATYTASSAPTTQGWTASLTGAGGGSLVTDQGASSWQVNGVGGRAQWVWTPGDSDRTDAANKGWRLTSTLRLASGGYITDYYANGSRRFLPVLSLNSSGQLVASLEGGGSYTLASGTAATAYHTYTTEYDPTSGQASFFFDGARVATWGGSATTQNYVAWGDGSTGTDSTAYYRSVKFEVLAPGESGRVERDVFVGGQEGSLGTAHYRIPALAVTPSGVLIAASEGRPSGSDPGVAGDPINISVKRSTDQGRTWSPVQVIAQNPSFDYSDPRLMVDQTTGAVFLFYVQWPDGCAQNGDCVPAGLGDNTSVLFFRKSTDGGATWGTPVNLNAQVKNPTWRSLNPGPGQGAQLRRQTAAQGGHNGRLLFPAIVRDGSSVFRTVTVYSDDGGVTWRAGSLTTAPGTTEADLVERNDGAVLLSARNDGSGGPNRYYSLSTDGGVTWTAQPGLGGVNITRVDVGLLALSSGQVLLSAPLGTPPGSGSGRSNLGVWVSTDSGDTFPTFKHLALGFAGYSSLAAQTNGNVGLLYEATGSTQIHFTSLPASFYTSAP
ncbi:hypothetical protein E5F05_01590 (plasmid) [Deinococcus metallilatus]|uniref:exo-alpha-sialidase n=1 Tax=Deinococcus metallilatus TaxID=1211322 RepID=A0ABR6MYE0_9DEIO|nr:exo-alpha-sialidase [Deinococcus metallilatus]MBB5296960.1 sialidase-1 [Deinococcus metallilatus]QBY06672.1 hypothetical protein E5F05_01590 [Deinococcus metallilatus]GMA15141.1 hypothetical protein GCM10025871_14720 [Deinococcus metallilatus]